MAPPSKKPSRPVFKTSSPFTETKCPQLSHEDQEVITELLCNLLSPLGEHRRTHVRPSKGKKRKRATQAPSEDAPPPPVPSLGSHLVIGLNSVTRHLEALAAKTAPPTVPVDKSNTDENEVSMVQDGTGLQHETSKNSLSMVIITHPQPSLSPSHAHLPTLLHLATLRPDLKSKTSRPARLVALPTSSDSRFASALHIPRVGAIGIYEDAPGAKTLEEYVRQHVGLTECLWVDEALRPEWRGLNIKQT